MGDLNLPYIDLTLERPTLAAGIKIMHLIAGKNLGEHVSEHTRQNNIHVLDFSLPDKTIYMYWTFLYQTKQYTCTGLFSTRQNNIHGLDFSLPDKTIYMDWTFLYQTKQYTCTGLFSTRQNNILDFVISVEEKLIVNLNIKFSIKQFNS